MLPPRHDPAGFAVPEIKSMYLETRQIGRYEITPAPTINYAVFPRTAARFNLEHRRTMSIAAT